MFLVFWTWGWKVVQVALIFTTPGCYSEMVDKLQKRVCRNVGPLLAASFKSLVHRRNVGIYLLYRYYFGKCSSELGELVLLPYSRGRSTRYSDRLHGFQQLLSVNLYGTCDLSQRFQNPNSWPDMRLSDVKCLTVGHLAIEKLT